MIIHKLADWLRHSSHVHMRQEKVTTLSGLVALLDRFLDDDLRYLLEWDDFISFESQTPAIESIRDRIADTELLFFSKDLTQINRGIAIVLSERNQAAALIGTMARLPSASDAA